MFCLQNSVCRLSYWKSRYKFSAAASDTFLVFKGLRSCWGWFSCRGVIVCSVVCCASLNLALKCVSARCLLTLCLTASGSYMRPACRKNTFHINLHSSLVEAFALMNHDLRENSGVFAPRDRPVLSHLAGSLVCHWETASGFLLDNRPLLLRGLPGQMGSVMHCSSSRAEQGVHGCQGYGWTRYLSSQWGAEEGNRQTENRRGDLSF